MNEATEKPESGKTRAVLLKMEQIEMKINKLQNVGEAVEMVRRLHQEDERRKSILYRLLKEALSLFFGDRK